MNTSLVRPKSDTFAMFSSEIKTFRAAKSLKKGRLKVIYSIKFNVEREWNEKKEEWKEKGRGGGGEERKERESYR